MMPKLTWRIEDFSKIDDIKIYSVTFVVNEYKWRLCLYPKGNPRDHLSLFLRVVDTSSLPDGWSVTPKFSLALINQIHTNKTIKKDTEGKYDALCTTDGYSSFISLSKLHNKSEGYLVDDICLIETEVSVLDDASQSSSDEVSFQSMYMYKNDLCRS
ncbi:unnamed protein product [Cuscuta epithymum]|uniref:MATH domain-containing protein n=1 Tax=Cuscuta epithymum TaxID=186058 RepID=A0AAV0ELB9_9ASTE|nr:unnamed protein product [Cuscuta epithymum]